MSTAVVDTGQDGWIPADTFGARCALVRQRMGWNVHEAAEACDLKESTWTGWEAGASPRNMEQVCRKIARASGISFSYLMLGGSLVSIMPFFAGGAVNPCDQQVLVDDELQAVEFDYPRLASVTNLASRRAS